MTDTRTPEQIWKAACLAMIQEMKAWGYEIRPFVTPAPYKAPNQVVEQKQYNIIKIKAGYELSGNKGARYRVLLTEGNDSFIQNVNENHPNSHKFWINNNKIEVIL